MNKIHDMPKSYLFKKGKENPNYGKVNELSLSWKGNNAGYDAIHRWVRKNKPKSKYCEKCNQERKLELSNISGKNKRNINDYKWMCIPCHRGLDNQKKFVRKLTKEDILEIREDYLSGNFYQRKLGERYNINQSTISRIVNKLRGNWI